MKALKIWLCCVAVLFLLASCEQEPDLEDYGIEKVDHTLSDKEIESCFNVLGLRFERFRCMIPKRSAVKLTSQQYIEGEARRGTSSGTMHLDKGLHEFTLFMKEQDNSISFLVQTSG